MLTLYDAARCPYCARARIVLAEKGVESEPVEVDLDAGRPGSYEKNPLGRVPVLEEDARVLPESAVITEYLEERYPEPPLLPPDASERSLGHVLIFRFDEFAHPYGALRRGEAGEREGLDRAVAQLDAVLVAQPALTGREYGLADIAYAPWLLPAQSSLGVELGRWSALTDWLDRRLERAVAAESELVSAR